MSVDVNAVLGYGFILDHEEYNTYKNKCDEKELDVSDYCWWVNSYLDDSEVFYGIVIESTDYITTFDKELFNMIDEDKWAECYRQWCEDFPDKKNEEPKYVLISNWW